MPVQAEGAHDVAPAFSLLDEPLLRYRRTADGATVRATLPELFVALMADQVRDFPALRPHQRHPWHAFLVQVAALALSRGQTLEPWQSAEAWRHALLALTPDDPDGAAWSLVSPASRPALLQAPVPGGSVAGWDQTSTPDRLDMLITSRNHDLKQARMRRVSAEDWLFALLSLQTQEGSNSGSYKGISRMNSGAGSRPGVGVAPAGGPGGRWRSDLVAVTSAREQVCVDRGLAPTGGIGLVWLVPWDGASQISFSTLDPLYVEICRRVRLVQIGSHLAALTTKTPASRIVDDPLRRGITGDPWSPINRVDEKVLTISGEGFHYKLVCDLLMSGDYTPGAAQDLRRQQAGESLQWVARGIARGNSKTAGYHERTIPVSPRLRQMLIGEQRTTLQTIARERMEAIASVRGLLWSSLVALFSSGVSDRSNPAAKSRASSVCEAFERAEDARFFDDLTDEVEAQDAVAMRLHWLHDLAHRAERQLEATFAAGPRSAMQRYKARAAARTRFHGGLRGSRPALPQLADHWREVRAGREEPIDAHP